jgi:phosphoglycerate-specific signal transduction histidine kinase
MKITKRQLKRIIAEEHRRLRKKNLVLTETIADTITAEAAINDLVAEFQSQMDQLFQEDPEMFAGRSTEREWQLQVDGATEMLAEELGRTVERIETMLHDGQFRR